MLLRVYFYIISLFLLIHIPHVHTASSTFSAESACSVASMSNNKGFLVKYYSVPSASLTSLSNINYLATGYTSAGLSSSASGISTISISFSYSTYCLIPILSLQCTSYSMSSIYGITLDMTQFVFEYTGYYSRM